MNMQSSIVWFRNDLRLHDNPVLSEASRSSDRVIPVYIFNPADWEEDEFGHKKTGAARTRFLIESVRELRKKLVKRGNDLLVEVGNPDEILNEIATKYQARGIYASKEFDPAQVELEKQVLRNVMIPVKFKHSGFLYTPKDAAFKLAEMPDTFNTFRKRCENKSMVRPLVVEPARIETPELEDKKEIPELSEFGFKSADGGAGELGVMKFFGGETEALARLEEYFWEKKAVRKYYNTRHELIGSDYSTKLSPWLATGCISPRFIKKELDEFESGVKKNKSTYWVRFQLIQRDYFRYLSMKYGKQLFKKEGVYGEGADFQFDAELFKKWKKGNTGIPFIDANMRELMLTGYMSSKGRHNVASFLTGDLNIDWRYGASWFRSQLIDYDVYNNWGNWAKVAGIAPGSKRNTQVNVLSETREFDPEAKYIKMWLPEMKKVSTDKILNWTNLSESDRKKAAPDYPQPCINLR